MKFIYMKFHFHEVLQIIETAAFRNGSSFGSCDRSISVSYIIGQRVPLGLVPSLENYVMTDNLHNVTTF